MVNKLKDPDTDEDIYDFRQVDEYKKGVYDEIFSLSYHGNGGWTWDVAYNLPIHLRKYCLRLLQQVKEKEQEQIKTATNKSESNKKGPQIPKVVHDNLNMPTSQNRRPPKKT